MLSQYLNQFPATEVSSWARTRLYGIIGCCQKNGYTSLVVHKDGDCPQGQ